MYKTRSGHVAIGSRLHFLGIVARVYYREDISEITIMDIPTQDIPVSISKQMINLGIVFKASNIVEAIEDFFSTRITNPK
jgi:hypothetical protein